MAASATVRDGAGWPFLPGALASEGPPHPYRRMGLVTDPASLGVLGALWPDLTLVAEDDAGEEAGDIVAASLTEGGGLLERLRGNLPDARVFGLFEDVLPEALVSAARRHGAGRGTGAVAVIVVGAGDVVRMRQQAALACGFGSSGASIELNDPALVSAACLGLLDPAALLASCLALLREARVEAMLHIDAGLLLGWFAALPPQGQSLLRQWLQEHVDLMVGAWSGWIDNLALPVFPVSKAIDDTARSGTIALTGTAVMNVLGLSLPHDVLEGGEVRFAEPELHIHSDPSAGKDGDLRLMLRIESADPEAWLDIRVDGGAAVPCALGRDVLVVAIPLATPSTISMALCSSTDGAVIFSGGQFCSGPQAQEISFPGAGVLSPGAGVRIWRQQ